MPHDVHAFLASLDYVRSRCLTRADLAWKAGAEEEQVLALIEGRALPRPSYRLTLAGSITNELGRIDAGNDGEVAYWAPAVLPWARRALALIPTLSPTEIGRCLKAEFRSDFVRALSTYPNAHVGWPELVSAEGEVDEAAVDRTLLETWDKHWLDGTFGVCLETFDGRSVVAKITERAAIRQLTGEGERPSLAGHEASDVRAAMRRLGRVITPFAPHERPRGTPGLWIDRVVERYGLK